VLSKEGTLLDSPQPAETLRQIAPVSVVVLSDRPAFHWQARQAAEWYRVEVFDESFNEVASSGRIAGTVWIPEQPLARGRLYEWQVRALSGGREIQAPAPPRKEARFRIADSAIAARIDAARHVQPVSHRLVAILSAQAGLRDEAGREIDRLAAENPGSPVVEKLRASLR
jgi:hypothetical protein